MSAAARDSGIRRADNRHCFPMRYLPPIEHPILVRGGIASRSDLIRAGHTPHSIAWAVGHQRIVRVRRAWYSLPDTEPDRVAAVRLGGRLGAFSAAKSYGIWRGLDRDLHVSWKPHGNVAKAGRATLERLPDGRHVIPHWRHNGFPDSGDHWRESPLQTLAQLIPRTTEVTAVAACDSALNLKLIDRADLDLLRGQLSARVAPWLGSVREEAESGLETIVRLWLVDQRHPPRLQVEIGPHTVDMLVGSSLIIETDGRTFHSDAERFEKDRVRTAELQARGYTVLRFSYRMVMFDWPAVEATIRAAIAANRHRDSVR